MMHCTLYWRGRAASALAPISDILTTSDFFFSVGYTSLISEINECHGEEHEKYVDLMRST